MGHIYRSEIKLQSCFSALSKAAEWLNEQKRLFNIPEKVFFNVYIAVSEALTNAIIHGNSHDTGKIIRLKMTYSGGVWTFTICDQGKGFDPAKIKSPIIPERIEKEGGRGIFIMQKLTSRMKYLNKGRTIQLSFKTA